MMKRFHFLAVLFSLTLFPSVISAEGIDETYQKPDTAANWGELLSSYLGFDGYKKSYALVVGISEYRNGFGNLPTRNDAKKMRDFLIHEAGFDYVHLLTEEKVTSERLRELVLSEFRKRVDENDRFLFYWSGHGVDVDNAIGGKEGYLPVSDSLVNEIYTMVPMSDMTSWSKQLRSEQSLYLLDTCFSGLAAVEKSSPLSFKPEDTRDYVINQLARPSHQLLSAGTADEEVLASTAWGGSLFTWAVINGLRGAADSQSVFPKDGIVSVSELMSYVKIAVEIERRNLGWSKRITPQMQNLRANEGEFFFITNREKLAALDRSGATPSGKFEYGVPVPKAVSPQKHKANPESFTFNLNSVQTLLLMLGYEVGKVDGLLGVKTISSIKQFQSDNGIAPSGKLDKVTRAALGAAVSKGLEVRVRLNSNREGTLVEPVPPLELVNDEYQVKRNTILRTGPGAGYQALRQLNEGDRVFVVGKVSDSPWFLVTKEGLQAGYVHVQRLKQPKKSEDVSIGTCRTIEQAVTLVDGTTFNDVVTACKTSNGWEIVQTQ